ncbi:SMP-30/gluconolactonase/LRE family protein [Burkholderia singularis]|uniref:L-arabinolactonase n=1 Tax=Burkholderia singularis TaxID=1503053 RepID=A0A238H7E7_9BURK|nr:SMP-30/gluconolactonase/LRE family protein [Burkholderia singularis]SMG01178.1 L-arabinolactonase [Burkholderia singularis]
MTNEIRADLLIDSRCALGEGATWCWRSGLLYWTDIEGRQLWRHDPSTNTSVSFPMPERLACFALCTNPRYLLLGLATHLAYFDTEHAAMTAIVDVEPGLPTRLNDGRCDRQGRFVFGTKHDVDEPEPIGGFYRLNADLTLERLPLPNCAISNSIAFAPDGRTMYYCDSPTRRIHACDYPTFASNRVFVELDGADGVPDGSTVDRDGYLWNAQWGASRVVRYAHDGSEAARIAVPTRQPSCVAFGGPRLGTLYVTSAAVGLADAARRADPHAGGVFAAQPGVYGLAEPVFGFGG